MFSVQAGRFYRFTTPFFAGPKLNTRGLQSNKCGRLPGMHPTSQHMLRRLHAFFLPMVLVDCKNRHARSVRATVSQDMLQRLGSCEPEDPEAMRGCLVLATRQGW